MRPKTKIGCKFCVLEIMFDSNPKITAFFKFKGLTNLLIYPPIDEPA